MNNCVALVITVAIAMVAAVALILSGNARPLDPTRKSIGERAFERTLEALAEAIKSITAHHGSSNLDTCYAVCKAAQCCCMNYWPLRAQ